MSDDWQAIRDYMARPDVRAAVARQSEAEEEGIPVNLTVEDMEWEAEIVFEYDGWDDDEGDGYIDEEEPPMEQGRLWEEGDDGTGTLQKTTIHS